MEKSHILKQERKKQPKWLYPGSIVLAAINICCFVVTDHVGEAAGYWIVIPLFAFDSLVMIMYSAYVGKKIYSYDYFAMRSYQSELSIKLCRDYIRLNNINDILRYEIKEMEKNRFRLYFPRQMTRGNAYVSQGTMGAEYQLNLYANENGTEITCMFLKGAGSRRPLIPWYIDKLLEIKCSAVVKDVPYHMEEEDWKQD